MNTFIADDFIGPLNLRCALNHKFDESEPLTFGSLIEIQQMRDLNPDGQIKLPDQLGLVVRPDGS